MSLPREKLVVSVTGNVGKVQAAALTPSPCFAPEYMTDHAAVVVLGKKSSNPEELK